MAPGACIFSTAAVYCNAALLAAAHSLALCWPSLAAAGEEEALLNALAQCRAPTASVGCQQQQQQQWRPQFQQQAGAVQVASAL
jgi:hypothetical protein